MIFIHASLKICSSYFHEARQDGSDSKLNQVIRGTTFNFILSFIFQHANQLSHLCLMPAYMLVSEIINNDSAPPGILSYLISSSIAEAALKGIAIIQDFSADLILYITNTISAIALTEDGIELILKHVSFSKLFSIFHDPKYFNPNSKTLIGEVPALFGGNIEELIRHYPKLTEIIIRNILGEIDYISSLCDYSKDGMFPNESETSRFLSHMNFASAILPFLETILSRHQPIVEFLKCDGFIKLFDLMVAAFGPPRFLLSCLSSSTEHVPNFLGYYPVMNWIFRCFEHLFEHKTEACMKIVIDLIKSYRLKLSISLKDYYQITDDSKSPIIPTEASTSHQVPSSSSSSSSSSALSSSISPSSSSFSTSNVSSSELDLNNFLDSIHQTPFHLLFNESEPPSTKTQNHILAYTAVLKNLLITQYLVEILSRTILPNSSSQKSILSFDKDEFSDFGEFTDIFKYIVEDVYLKCQVDIFYFKFFLI
jgi:hypothetical protein